MAKKARKISIVGTGTIGSTVAYTLLLKNLTDEIVLINRNEARGRAKASDFSHCTPLLGDMVIRHGSFADTDDSDAVAITAGVLPSENGTRMDVLRSNIEIYKSIIPEIVRYSPNAVIIVITNPVDVMAYVAYKLSGFPAARVIGSGTLLDTIRFKYFLGESFGTDPTGLDAVIVGEHGDSMVPLWNQTRFAGCNQETKAVIEKQTKRAGWEIRLGNEHSCYGISLSVISIIEGLLGFSTAVLPVSTMPKGEYGIEDVYLSLPVRLGPNGVQGIEKVRIYGEELEKLQQSAKIISGYIKEADLLLEGGGKDA